MNLIERCVAALLALIGRRAWGRRLYRRLLHRPALPPSPAIQVAIGELEYDLGLRDELPRQSARYPGSSAAPSAAPSAALQAALRSVLRSPDDDDDNDEWAAPPDDWRDWFDRGQVPPGFRQVSLLAMATVLRAEGLAQVAADLVKLDRWQKNAGSERLTIYMDQYHHMQVLIGKPVAKAHRTASHTAML